MTDARFERYREAYMMVAKQARYRPQAPGDGMGNVDLTREELGDRQRLEQEATAYAKAFGAEEDRLTFAIGCSDFETNRAFIWTIEAARALAAAAPDVAVRLLNMATEEIARR